MRDRLPITFTFMQDTGAVEKARGETSAPFISGTAWNLPSPGVPPSRQRCWLTPHQWGAEGADMALQSPARCAGPGSIPPSLPASLVQSGHKPASRHPSARCSWEGGLLGWASSFPQQMNLMGRMCLQNTLSLIHPLWSSQKTLPEDLTFPCLP